MPFTLGKHHGDQPVLIATAGTPARSIRPGLGNGAYDNHSKIGPQVTFGVAHALYACAAHPVAKPGSAEGYRFTVDYSPVNNLFESITNHMPNIEVMLTKVAGSRVFAKFDMLHAFWQIPLAPESQDYLSFQTPIGTTRRLG
jgi:hypothetical protein